VNYAATSGTSDPLELAHGLGMVGMGALLPWGLALLADRHLLHYEDPTAVCAANRFCQRCWKRTEVACGLHRMFLVVAPALAVLSLMPLTAPIVPSTISVPVFDSEVIYPVTLNVQLVQFRLYPAIAGASFVIAMLVLWRRGRQGLGLAKPFFFVGTGFAGFALMRFFLFHTYSPVMPGWTDLWEEVTEWLVTVFVLALLLLFRRPLGVLGFVDEAWQALRPKRSDPR
jgi:hypothetical protein